MSNNPPQGFGLDPIPGLSRLSPDSTYLTIRNGKKAGQSFSLNKIRILIGRSDPPEVNVDIDLTEYELGDPPMSSRRHAELQWVNGQLQIVDLASRNGTFVDGQRLTAIGNNQPIQAVTLKIGSIIKFANLEMEITRHV
jgi:pSer/pThr/pTyr-binding forkhead associated (FHA) protein